MKIYNQGKLIEPRQYHRRSNGRFSSIRMFFRKVWFWTKVAAVLGVIVGASFGIGAFTFSSTTVKASATTVVVEAPSPILDRISDCESGSGKKGGGRQFNADGSVVEHVNTNGTVDVGKFQINMNADNLRTMAKLGLNPLTEEGNTQYAKWLYQNVGTGPWASSQGCWKR